MRKLAGFALMSVVVGVSACDGGPSGPGSINATLESATQTAGAAVVEVRGAGVRGFTSTGPVQVFWGAGSDPGSFRVVLVNPGEAAQLQFSIQVDDLAAAPPTGTAVEAASLTNAPILEVSDFTLRLTN